MGVAIIHDTVQVLHNIFFFYRSREYMLHGCCMVEVMGWKMVWRLYFLVQSFGSAFLCTKARRSFSVGKGRGN
jgi:hypothetical protein